MKTQSYAAFSANLATRAVKTRAPLSVSIEVTYRCPLDCAHCYDNLPMGDTAARSREMSLDEHRRILDELADAGCMYLLFTGGEIFARRDFLDIYAYARSKGFLVTLFTGATLVTPRIADALAASPPFAIEVTLYGADAATYETSTGVRGSFARCMRGIELLRERGLPLRLKTVGVVTNAHTMDSMRSLAERLTGGPMRFDAMINPRTDGTKGPLATRLSPEAIVELDLRDPARVAGWREFAASHDQPVPSHDGRDLLYHCGGGVTACAIDPEGKLSICVLSHRDEYDLRRGSFDDGWNHFLRAVRSRETKRITRCSACAIKAMCGMCPAVAELEGGDPEEPVEHFCEVAHLRAETLGIRVPAHGACPWCDGGARHDELVAAAVRVRDAATRAPVREARRALPMLDTTASSCGTGGCGSCH